MKKKLMLLMLLMMCGLTACSQDQDKTGDKAQKKTEDTDEEEDDEDTDEETGSSKKKKKDKKKDKEDSSVKELKQLEGGWQYVCRKTYSGTEGDELEDMESSFFIGNNDDLYGFVEFYEEDGVWYADISESQYEYYHESYHFPAEVVNTPLYEQCENQDWHVSVRNKRKDASVFEATLVDENKLVLYSESIYGEEDEEKWKYVDIRTYLRDGSEDLEHVDDLCYEKTVTVSDIGELLEAIDNNTKIILKPGDYDISAYSEEINNPKISAYKETLDGREGYGSVYIHDVSYLYLEVEGGGKAEISVDTPYSAVLYFNDCDR
ncbi:MAG: hypothetical protein K5888_03600, partial [Lachnospiraceae bacterium]|nr:hypothetical protein [Lachnospiraceae bacterium]